jgi:hypothetical protein
MNTDKDENALGDKQSDFAGTNPDRYGQPDGNQQDPNTVAEAQNVSDDDERLSGEEAERATRKATEGERQGRSDS